MEEKTVLYHAISYHKQNNRNLKTEIDNDYNKRDFNFFSPKPICRVKLTPIAVNYQNRFYNKNYNDIKVNLTTTANKKVTIPKNIKTHKKVESCSSVDSSSKTKTIKSMVSQESLLTENTVHTKGLNDENTVESDKLSENEIKKIIKLKRALMTDVNNLDD